MKQKLVLIVSAVVGLLAFFLTTNYLAAERAKLYKGAEKVQVIMASRDLSAGSTINLKGGDLGLDYVFKNSVGENVCKIGDEFVLDGKKLLFPVKRNEPLMWSYVDMPDRGRSGLAGMVKPGMRAVSIAVNGPNSVSGLVQPNDRVDILGTFTFPSRKKAGETEAVTLTVLQDVTVLATGTRLGKSGLGNYNSPAGSYSSVTLLVTPREAEVLVFAQHVKGQLLLTLRNPEDVSFEKNLPEVDFQQIETKLPELNQYRQQFIWQKKNL
jgi:pilus assembly protein CpaB